MIQRRRAVVPGAATARIRLQGSDELLESKSVRSVRALGAFLFRDLSPDEFRRLFRREAPALLDFHLRGYEEAAAGSERAPARFLSKLRFVAGRILKLMSPARRFLFVLALALAVVSVFFQGNLPLIAFAILAFLLVLELSEKLLARDEIEIAREVQASLFPRADPSVAGWQLASRNVPANDVGGDYYDYIPRPESSALGIALGDVAGKGMGAALLVANLQAALRAFLQVDLPGAPGDRPPEVTRLETLFSSLNRALAGMVQSNRFASLVYGELEPGSGRFLYVNAGQNPPMVVRADGEIVDCHRGMILGVLPDAPYRAGEVSLGPGDALVLYCDGVTERFDPQGREFEERRLADVLRGARGLGGRAIRDAILAAVERHAAGVPAGDDVTLVVASRDPLRRP